MQYEAMCREILDGVGGSDNIRNCYHCFTRLRIEVKDLGKADIEALGKIKGIMKIVQANTQIQCVIGQKVNDVYEDFLKIADIKGGGEADADAGEAASGPKEKLTPKKIVNIAIDAISGCIQPLLPGIICAGMLKMIVSILGPSMLGILREGDELLTLLTFNVIAGTAGLVASFAVAFILTMVFGIGREDGSSDLGADEELLS